MKPLNDQIAVTSQLLPSSLAHVKAQGYQSIICNRPEYEEAGQPEFTLLAKEADKHGLTTHHLPVKNINVSDQEVEAFKQSLEALPKPILAFCKTGTRAATLWVKSQLGTLDDETIKVCCQNAGYQINLE